MLDSVLCSRCMICDTSFCRVSRSDYTFYWFSF